MSFSNVYASLFCFSALLWFLIYFLCTKHKSASNIHTNARNTLFFCFPESICLCVSVCLSISHLTPSLCLTHIKSLFPMRWPKQLASVNLLLFLNVILFYQSFYFINTGACGFLFGENHVSCILETPEKSNFLCKVCRIEFRNLYFLKGLNNFKFFVAEEN